MDVHDFACPDCGYDGPHPVIEHVSAVVVVECGNTACAREFRVDPDIDGP